ncbi:FAD-dependent oxidoreductase [Phaeodactylibacter sp.]|uniref:NAD(P)/FAD-dependent oxidoreductase n=1 Tax=Phaeodactylibacter sp. TaxID=1940289 RepID=UPI0025F0AE70|nr:FAD-dependent oxidoreductase [Phaeodactylibacter sp.]MCI4649259.1 FAD-binding oxidoreductase [Phaeodactylibacter sp.]MCI5089898.1 FAD-binding oxidoreductase [Phaeodactylibacter sp.]
MEQYDFLIVGGGIFGIYAALFLRGQGQRVLLVEKEKVLLKKASIVNQARLHSGYHYPRSVATARMSDDNKARFTADHQDFINFEFEKYYAIDRFGSFTDAAQFERFCAFIGIPCEPVERHPYFNYHRLEALYKTVEYTFDPILIAEYYRQRLYEASPEVTPRLFTEVVNAAADGDQWQVGLKALESGKLETVKARQVINATYAGSNAINRLFGVRDIDLMHEISEMAFVNSPQVRDIGLTIMDGPFGSIMPYGKSGLLSLSSVAYTHHKVSYGNLPTFDCQQVNTNCRPDFTDICNFCPAKPASNYRKMLGQIRHYFTDKVEFQYFTSMFTIKSKLKASYIDDGRPTEISVLHENPKFYCIFAGKINSIYEIEKVVSL